MVSKIDVICDRAQSGLQVVPRDVLEMNNLQMLYLEGNSIERLPSDLFQKLPKLTWLDLRNNKLKEIPVGIAHHQCLDTLLLENNQLEKLPNELGLCPNLLILQIQDNPLSYPPKGILEQGTIVTREFLKAQFERDNAPLPTTNQNSCSEVSNSAVSEPIPLLRKKKISVQELLRRASAAARAFQKDTPVITVKALSPKNSGTEATIRQPKEAKEVVEQPENSTVTKSKMTKYCPKLSVNSHFNSNKYLNVKKSRPNKDRVVDQQLKDIWLSKLKELLDQQEKLLQQERNLQALSKWRLQKKLEPLRNVQQARIEAPYDTDPEYETMLQREDLYREVDHMVRKKRRFTRTVDMRKMISELVMQLKALETNKCSGNNSEERNDRDELERNRLEIRKLEGSTTDDNSAVVDSMEMRAFEMARAESVIRRIIDLHKKVTALQAMNNVTL